MSEVSARASLVEISPMITAAATISYLRPDQDFYDAGLASVASLTLLLDLEEKFGISIPDESFVQCRTAESIANLVQGLQQ
ncbi:MAG: hypothetical protein NVS9B15_12440 [Acidobacteriaceae bacterium]